MNYPGVSIIITSYFPDSKKYLDLCIESIRNLNYMGEIEVIVVGRPDYMPEYPGVKTIAPPLDKFYPPVGLNCGMKAAKHDLMLVINDDTILTKHSVSKLVDVYQANPAVGLLMPISNDQQSRYSAWVGIPATPYRYETLKPIAGELMNNESKYPPALACFDTLCIYAFMISKKVYADVGDFDEKLIAQDDIDYTLRLRQKGYLNAITFDSIIYHFGGVSADKTFTSEIRAESMRKFQEKWASI